MGEFVNWSYPPQNPTKTPPYPTLGRGWGGVPIYIGTPPPTPLPLAVTPPTTPPADSRGVE